MTVRSYSSLEMIEALVAFDTTSAKSNLDLIDFVDDYLKGHGVPTRRTLDDSGQKANLFATLGPEIEGGIVLSGHTDVVPVTGQPWTVEPFAITRRDGRLYGRGTSDMKSFSAVALALVPEALAAPLRRPIHLALSYDEEVGCIGVGRLIADIKQALPLPRIVIVGEPSSMKLVNAHKGIMTFNTRLTGKEAHSSQPHRSGNAIMAAAELVAFIARMAREKRAAADPDNPFEPPYTTFNVGLIEGGNAANIVPRHCSFSWEFRSVPGDDDEAILERFTRYAETEVLPVLRENAPDAEIVTEMQAQAPALAPETDSPAEALIRVLTGANQATVVSYATEGGHFQGAGLSTVICGPGSIDQAHQPDEFIEVSQVEACEAMLRRLIDWARSEA